MASPASLTWSAQPGQLSLASIASPALQASQHSQHPTAHIPQSGAGGRGHSPEDSPHPKGVAGRDGTLS